jgi:hypothetical protein
MDKKVNVEGLNIRSTPLIDPSNRQGVLHLGQTVTVLEESPDNEWIMVETSIDGSTVTGYVKRLIQQVFSLREFDSVPRETLVSNVISQWVRFDQGQGMEYDAPFSGYVGEMWKSIKLKLDGNDRDVPWSAAFISFVVRKTAAEIEKCANFKFAPSHSKYLHDSIARREAGDSSAPFWGYRLSERKPAVGDIVAKWRDAERTYNDAWHSDSFKSHCDVIVSAHAEYVVAIGGNVGQSVNISRYDKNGAGFLLPTRQAFMLMVNMT